MFSDDVLVRLEESKVKVAERWTAFHSEHGSEIGDGLIDIQQKPRIETLWKAVHDAEIACKKRRETGFGKTRSAIERFMNTMNNYSYIFSVIPNGDRYTCLVTGIITSITKASRDRLILQSIHFHADMVSAWLGRL